MDIQATYWDFVEQKVCGKCIDGDGKGNCRLDPSRTCALKDYFPYIVIAVNRVQSHKMEDYVHELRSIVCAGCAHENGQGLCALRESLECSLDRYYPLVVDAIEEVNRFVTVEED